MHVWQALAAAARMQTSRSMALASWSFSPPTTKRVGYNPRLTDVPTRSQCRLRCVQGIQDAGRDSWGQRSAGAALLVELAQDAERLWYASQADM